MSEIQATYQATDTAFHVEGYEKIEFDLLYVNGAFAPENARDRGAVSPPRSLSDGGR